MEKKPDINIFELTYAHLMWRKRKDSDTDPNTMYVAMLDRDYTHLNNYILKLQREIQALNQQLKDTKTKYTQWAKEQRNLAEVDADEKIKEAQAKIQEAQEQIQAAEHLNDNLKRILKERANADRKIKPKKKKSGYVVIRSEQGIRYDEDANGHKIKSDIWKTLVESPWNIGIPEPQARKEILQWVKTSPEIEFEGKFFNNFKMIKDYNSHLWRFWVDTTNEIQVKEDTGHDRT